MFLIERDAIEDGGFAAVEASIDGEPESLVLYREGDVVRGWLNVCPHAGRPLDYAPGKFVKSRDGLLLCPVHGAGFATDTGECKVGPCVGQALRAVALELREGGVYLAAVTR